VIEMSWAMKMSSKSNSHGKCSIGNLSPHQYLIKVSSGKNKMVSNIKIRNIILLVWQKPWRSMSEANREYYSVHRKMSLLLCHSQQQKQHR
jgi:hypothetical protein